jgi:3-oxoacyl-[acyl-carrier-protein] synthase III
VKKLMAKRIAMTIRGMGSAVPERVMTNADFEKLLDTSDEWIKTRTGISERRIASPGENTLTLATAASRKALASAGLQASDLDLVIVATSTPVTPLPATACFLQHELGCGTTPGFDISAACSGFVYALVTGAHLLGERYRNVLVVGAETMSAITDFEDRGTCILLGDAAGAAILSAEDDGVSGLYEHFLHADGVGAEMIYVPAGGSRVPASVQTVSERQHYLKMRGRDVYKFAVTRMQEIIQNTASSAGVSLDDIKMVIPHQSNARIIESAVQKLGLPPEKVAINIDRFGNTSAASIPLAMDECYRAGKFGKGDWVLIAGFGAGLTWGSALIRW